MGSPDPGPRAVADRWDECLALLSSQLRRQLVQSLLEATPERALALPDAAMTTGMDDDRDRVAIALRHSHLPKLADAGYIRWTEEPFEVQRGPRFEEAATFLDLLVDSGERLPDAMVAGCVE